MDRVRVLSSSGFEDAVFRGKKTEKFKSDPQNQIKSTIDDLFDIISKRKQRKFEIF